MNKNNQEINRKALFLTIASMCYITIKLTCNPLFFRLTDFTLNIYIIHYVVKVFSSTFIYPLVYVVSDIVTALSNRRIAICIIIVGIVCDGFFSYSIYYASLLQLPHFMTASELKNASYVNYMGHPIWKLYYSGVIGTIITSVVEVLIFNKLYKKMQNFFTSTILSIIVVIVVHNPIAALPIWNEPDYWRVVTNGLIVDISFLIAYVLIAYLVTKTWLYKINVKS